MQRLKSLKTEIGKKFTQVKEITLHHGQNKQGEKRKKKRMANIIIAQQQKSQCTKQ